MGEKIGKSINKKQKRYAPVAQLAERNTCNVDVAGSSPVRGSIIKFKRTVTKYEQHYRRTKDSN